MFLATTKQVHNSLKDSVFSIEVNGKIPKYWTQQLCVHCDSYILGKRVVGGILVSTLLSVCIEQQPPFGDRKYSNTLPQKRGKIQNQREHHKI